jgi:2'-5' RNA ligase
MGKGSVKTGLCLMPRINNDAIESFRYKYINDPGKEIPLHITLLYRFLLPEEMDAATIEKLKAIAASTRRFEFWAKPLASFPTSNVLYLLPSPVTPIENLTQALYDAFPAFHTDLYGYPTYHMTVAFNNPKEKTDDIIKEYLQTFEYNPLQFEAGSIDMFVFSDNEWTRYMSFELGK